MPRLRHERRFVAVLTVAILSQACEPEPSVVFRPCTLDGFSGVAECTTFEVPLAHGGGHDAVIGIYAARVRARRVRRYDAPLVILAGGPGQAATDYASSLESAFRRVNDTRDILFIDQRGTGRSHPLRCDSMAPAHPYGALSLDELAAGTAACRAQLTEDPRYFGTEAVIRDLDLIRARLGHDQLALWGASFGTRTALRYLSRFPQRVESMVIDGVTSNTESLFLRAPDNSHAAFEALVDRCHADPSCDGPRLSDQFARTSSLAPATVTLADPLTGASITTIVDGQSVRDTVRGALYFPSRASLIPLAMTRLFEGDYSILAALSADTASWAMDTMYAGATLSILCSEDVDRIDPRRAVSAGRGRRFGNRYFEFWSTACIGWPRTKVPADYGQRVESAVPTLVLSGGLDPVTPPAAAKVAIQGLSHAQHLVAKNVGHNVTPFGCAPKLIAQFLDERGATIDGQCLNEIEAPAIVRPGEIIR